MRISFHIYRMVFALALCFFGVTCGVKKVATPIDTIKSDGEQAVNHVELHQHESPTDSLSFLGDLINDSTIHINYVYGIPFVIDDSVPMFLPPIDKDPQGYVSSQKYRINIGKGGMLRNNSDRLLFCGISNPADNILWLNKCLNDLYNYVSIEEGFIEPTHNYVYSFRIIEIKGIQLLKVIVHQMHNWNYWHEDYHCRLQTYICYYFDCEGNLLGKMYTDMPVEYIYDHGVQEIPLRKSIPDYDKFAQMYIKAKEEFLILFSYLYIYPGSACSLE